MRKSLFFALFCAFSCAQWAAAQPHTFRKTLDHPTQIQGYPCDKGYAWFYRNGKLQHCAITRDIPFGEIAIPAGSWIALTEDGSPWGVQMSHDAPILGLVCQGGSVLGSGEGPQVALYPNGKLKLCSLAHDQLVQGIPCAHGGIVASISSIDPGVYLYESGKLKSCKLAADYGAMKKGDRFQQGP